MKCISAPSWSFVRSFVLRGGTIRNPSPVLTSRIQVTEFTGCLFRTHAHRCLAQVFKGSSLCWIFGFFTLLYSTVSVIPQQRIPFHPACPDFRRELGWVRQRRGKWCTFDIEICQSDAQKSDRLSATFSTLWNSSLALILWLNTYTITVHSLHGLTQFCPVSPLMVINILKKCKCKDIFLSLGSWCI